MSSPKPSIETETARREAETSARLRKALMGHKLAIIVGAGVTLNATADASGQPLSRLRWTGLVRNGLDYLVECRCVDRTDRRTNRAYEALEDPDIDGLLDAADILSNQLTKHNQLPTWLHSVFENLYDEVRHTAILEALKKLFEKGAIILTTNYDDILERYFGTGHVGRSRKEDVFKFRCGDLIGVFHIHGSYHDPQEIVLDTTDYYQATRPDDATQDMLRAFLNDRTLLFIGCGSGLEDPNFDALLKWATDSQKHLPNRHCLLIRRGDTLNHKPLLRVPYGEDYDDLASYLNQLLDATPGSPTVRGSKQTTEQMVRKLTDQDNKIGARVSPLDLTAAMAMLGELDGLKDKFESLQLSLHANSHVGRERILEWLNAIFTDDEWEKAVGLRTPETCQWIAQRHFFQDWTSTATGTGAMKLLWIHGPPGFGKTVLCASIVERLKKENRSRVGYFFCVSDDEAKRQPPAIVRSWVAQMVNQNQEALEAAREVYRGKEGRWATTSDVWQLFGKICQRIPNCFFVVDGFDECIKVDQTTKVPSTNGAQDFLEKLTDAGKDTPSYILFVSREDADLRLRFRRLTESSSDTFIDYEISASDTRDDAKSFSASIIAKNLPKKDSILRDELTEQASQRCQGMFLLLRLLGNRLSSDKNAKQLRKIVSEMPTGIEKCYESDLKRILNLGDETDRAVAILRWTLFSQRPLTVRELTEALVVDMDDDYGVYPKDDLPDTWEEDEVNDQIRRLCGSLIELRGRDEGILPQDQTVHFVHFSVREYLSRTPINFPSLGKVCLSDAARQHDLLAQICLHYMSYDELTKGKPFEKEAIQEKMEEYRFLKYAAKYWYIHARNSAEWSRTLIDQTNKFFEPNGFRWILWSKIFDQKEPDEKATTVPNGMQPRDISPLYYASLLGLMHPLRNLRKEGFDCNASGTDGGSALLAAAQEGHLEVVKFLAAEGAKINTKDTNGFTPLDSAARNGHLEVVQFLVEQQAEVNTKYTNGLTPLHLAAGMGHLEVVKFLVEQEAEVNTKDTNGLTPLHLATLKGHLEVVKFLVEQEAEVNTKDSNGLTPLYLAAGKGHLEVVKFLVEQEAEVNTEVTNGLTPLYSAILNSHLEVVKFLVEQEAEVNTEATDGLTPLHLAAQKGNLEVAKFLVEQEAEVNTKDSNGLTPLYLAAQEGHLEVVKFLVEQEAEVNTEATNGLTPLHSATLNSHLEVVKFLVEQEAEVNTKATDGITPLYLAILNGHLEVVKFLVEQEAEVNTKATDGITPLYLAILNGHLEVVKFLVEQEAEVNTKATDGLTPLHLAAQEGHLEVIKFLVEQEAEVNTKDSNGLTPLYLAAGKGHLEVVKFLVEQEAEVNTEATNGLTPLHSATLNSHLEVVKFLVEQEAEVNTKATDGITPLYLAILNGHLEVVKFLVEQEAEVNTKDSNGLTPLHLAAGMGHLEVVKFLVEQEAEVNTEATNGLTPLHSATLNSHLEVVKFLVEQEAEVNTEATDGLTPLHLAAQKGNLEVAKFLVEQEAEVNTKDSNGLTPLYLAAQEGHLEVVKFLVERDAEIDFNTIRLLQVPFDPETDHNQIEVVRVLMEHRESRGRARAASP